MRGLGLCRVLVDLGWEEQYSNERGAIAQEHKTTTARRLMFRHDEIMDQVPVICEGWAASMVQLTSGRRQILSFLLPGDMITAALLFDQQLHYSVDAITRGSYRGFDRARLRDAMLLSPKIFERLLSAYNEEKNRADRLITDLGRRTAPERVARLILDLWDRLGKAGMVENHCIDFPLRQTHIADATGLTPVYVNKVLSEFRRSGLVTITERSLQMTDETRLRRLAA
jgi:CRP-like cAMP-binding protein